MCPVGRTGQLTSKVSLDTSDFWALDDSKKEKSDKRPFLYSEPLLTRMLGRAHSEGINGIGIDGMLNKSKIITYISLFSCHIFFIKSSVQGLK